jgi:hypothetical protein
MQALQDLGKCFALVLLIFVLVGDKASDAFVYLQRNSELPVLKIRGQI